MRIAVCKRWVVTLGCAASIAVGALASAQAATPDSNDMPPVLKQAADAGSLTVDKSFATELSGVTGYVIERSGRHQIVYGQDGYLFMGQLVSPAGKNLSAAYADEYLPKPDVAKVVDQLEDTGRLIQQGADDAPVMYVFADPNCTYCHRFYEQAEPLVKAGKLQLRWALVAMVKKSSMGRAAAIITADDPLDALVENEAGFDEQSENGGIAPLDSVPDDLEQVLKQNYRQMTAAGGTGTPTLLYKQDGGWVAKVGAPGRAWLQQYVGSQR